MNLIELLDEIDDDPAGYDFMDVDQLLRLAGYTYHEYPGTRLYRHIVWNSTYTFTAQYRTIPASYMKRIARELRANLVRDGKST